LPQGCRGIRANRDLSDSHYVGLTNAEHRAELTVLCIEDDTASLTLIQATIGARPHVELLVATDGAEGTEMARRCHPDLVLADLDLSGMGGEEVLARLRVDPVTRPVPVVILGGDPDTEVVDRLIARGARACLAKPINAGELARCLDDGVDGAGAGRLRRAA
jgi:CheY-like chemotaxis protein